MTTADLINGGISLAVSFWMALIGFGVIPMDRNREKSIEKHKKYGWLAFLGAFIVGIMGVFKLFGVMR